jgi:hypothetical protein
MKPDEIYKIIGYSVVVIFIIYVIANTIRLQTGIFVEGFGEKKKSNKMSTEGGGGDFKKKCEPDKKALPKAEITNAINKLKIISGKYQVELCENYNKKQKYYIENSINQEINEVYDNCINHHKILAVIDSINISQAYIDVDIKNDDERDVVRNDKMEILRNQVENVKALEDCKNYYNYIYGKM